MSNEEAKTKLDGGASVSTAMLGAWVPVTERLPDIDFEKPKYAHCVRCLVASERGDVWEAKYSSNAYAKTEKGRAPRWEESDGRLIRVAPMYWMPMPKAPN